MKKTPNKDSLTRMCELLDRQPRSLKGFLDESVSFQESDDYEAMDGADMDDENPVLDDMVVGRQANLEDSPIDGSEEKVNQIRRIALQGVAELADQPTSKHYDLFKRIWSLVDKFVMPDNTATSSERQKG